MKRLPLVLVLFYTLFLSCNSNLSLDNIDFDSEIGVATPLIFFDLSQNKFYDFQSNTEVLFVSDTTRYTFLSEGIVKDNLQRLDLFYNIDNSFDREFVCQIKFLDDNNDETHVFDDFTIPANRENFLIDDFVRTSENPLFIETTKFVLNVTLLPGNSTIDPTVTQRFSFRSSGILTLSY